MIYIIQIYLIQNNKQLNNMIYIINIVHLLK